jgi:LysM repeat protein
MNKTKLVLLLAAAVLLMGLTACERPLSTPSGQTGQATAEFKVLGEPTIDLAALATQTAQAAPGAKAVATQQPDGAAAAPTSEVSQAGGGAPATVPQVASQPQAPAFEPTPGHPDTYTLQKGEWPICIARRYNLDLSSFFALNGFNMNSRPAIGATMKLPQGGSWSSNYGSRTLRAHGKTHYVQAGETIYTIACSYGDVDPNGIIAVNNLKEPYTLNAGQTINLP